VKLYRAMTPDNDGLPRVGSSARELGVRGLDKAPNNDVDATLPTDTVRPGKGMSVAPLDPGNLAKNRRPPEVGDGTGKDPVWVLDSDDIGAELRFNQDKPTHGLLEPARPMTKAEFDRAIAATRDRWKLYQPGTTKGDGDDDAS
jgi:hypothetical protein